MDDHNVDVRIVHGFRATYDEPIANVRKRAETYLLQQHAAEAAAAAASLQQKGPAVAGQDQVQTAAAEATAAAQYAGSSHNVGHQQQDRMPSHSEHQQHHPQSDHYTDHSGLGCVCRELHEGEDGLIPDYVKRTADCVVHEQDTGTESEYASLHSATLSSASGRPSITNLNELTDSQMQASAAGMQAGGKEAVGSAAGAGSPFAASPFQAGNLEPFSLPSSSRTALQQQQPDVTGQPLRYPYKQPHEGQVDHSVRNKADNTSVQHGGRRLSVGVLRTADHRTDETRGSSSAVAQPTAVHSDGTTAESVQSAGEVNNSSNPLPGHQQQQNTTQQQQQPLVSSPSSSVFVADSVPSTAGGVAVAPGPAVGQDWQQQQPVLVTLRHRKTAHGHQQIDVQPLPTADCIEGQQQIEQQQGFDSSIEQQEDLAHQKHLQHVTLQQQQQQQQYQNTMTQLDMNILHPPEGFLPLSGDKSHQAQQHHSQQDQQHAWGPRQDLALVPTPKNPAPTLMMPRPSIQGKQPPRAQPREGFVPRCEWELDPRKVLVGRRLAVGGFAEVFIGKYEVSSTFAVPKLCGIDCHTTEFRFIVLALVENPNAAMQRPLVSQLPHQLP